MATSSPKKQFLGLSSLEIAILVILLCIGCVFAGLLVRASIFEILSEPTSENNPAPAQIARANYRQMLEANGFVYRMNDEDGDPIYASPCGCVVTVKPDYMGFAVQYNPDNDCGMQDLGAIISTMYPSEVFDFILSNIQSIISEDQTVHGTAAGYDIKMDFDPYDPKLIIVIKDPR